MLHFLGIPSYIHIWKQAVRREGRSRKPAELVSPLGAGGAEHCANREALCSEPHKPSKLKLMIPSRRMTNPQAEPTTHKFIFVIIFICQFRNGCTHRYGAFYSLLLSDYCHLYLAHMQVCNEIRHPKVMWHLPILTMEEPKTQSIANAYWERINLMVSVTVPHFHYLSSLFKGEEMAKIAMKKSLWN